MNPLAVLGFLKDHWRGCGISLGFVAAFAGGYRTYPVIHPPVTCAPAVTRTENDHKAKADVAVRDTVTDSGPRKIIKLNFDKSVGSAASTVSIPGVSSPVAVPAGERLESATIEEDGPKKIEAKVQTDSRSTEDRHLDLTIRPLPSTWQPRFEFQAGLEDVLSDRAVRLAARIRVSDRSWVEVSGRPREWMAGKKDVGLAVAGAF